MGGRCSRRPSTLHRLHPVCRPRLGRLALRVGTPARVQALTCLGSVSSGLWLTGKGACVDVRELASDSMNVVLLGEFKPLQITPRWLRQMDLIGAEDYESYTIEVISPAATVLSFGSIKLQTVPENLQIATDASSDAEAARDLAVGILLSNGSPSISSMGINRLVHFRAKLEQYHAIGDALTPKDLWDDVLHLPGMLNLGITGVRDDGYGGAINVQVQPSAVVRPGVFVSVNDHYDLTYAETPTNRNGPTESQEATPERSPEKIPTAVKILTEGFSDSRSRAEAIIDRVISLGTFLRGTDD
jgi:hypothetical protein